MPVSARVQPVSPIEAVLLVADEAGAWRPFLRHRGPDAEARCEATRRELEAGTFDHEGRLPESAGKGPGNLARTLSTRRADRGPGNRAQTPIEAWTVPLPATLRPLFESLALANGGTAEQAVAAYLESDDFLVDLARDAARRAS